VINGDKPSPRQSLIVVVRNDAKEGDRELLEIKDEYFDDGAAHSDAEGFAKANPGTSFEVYRRVVRYKAEIKVTHRLDGE
jgi:hypothetical protein